MIFSVFQKKSGFWVFSVHPTVVLLAAHAERFFVSRMQDIFWRFDDKCVFCLNLLNLLGIGATIRTQCEIQCVPCAGFFFIKFWRMKKILDFWSHKISLMYQFWWVLKRAKLFLYISGVRYLILYKKYELPQTQTTIFVFKVKYFFCLIFRPGSSNLV